MIAILDFWSQTALAPLHSAVGKVLARLSPNDCTFDQKQFARALPLSGPYYSFDLSNATDRMPLLLQKAVLARMIGATKAEAWARILVGYEYDTNVQPSSVRYAAGQPMGAYSSWPIMALTHHFIVQLAALRARVDDYRGYALLGDDLVLTDERVAREYQELLRILDMPYSAAKTHVSIDTYEFAKR